MNKKSQKMNIDSQSSKYLGKYQIIKKIGEGSYAKIYKVKKDSSDKTYVLKNIPVSEEDYSSMKEILNESSILSTCDNIYVVKYYDSFFYSGTFNIITEFCPYGDLFGYIKFYKERGSKIEEKIIWIIFIQLSLGLSYLHHKKILHRDIKTKNIFIKNNLTVKIGDFGIAKILNSTSSYAHTFIGTPYYISPELCKDQPYNDKSDVWSLGCVLYELCTLNHPFEGGTQVEIYEKIMTQKFKAISPEYSLELKKMVDLLLEKDEKKRPKMKDILRMKCVIDKANNYNINIDLVDNGIIEEEKSDVNSVNNAGNVNKMHDNKNNLKNNSYNVNINNNNNKESIYKNSGKKEKYEKSPNHYSNKAKKFKNECDSKEIKNNKIKIDNILKNNQLKKINNAKNKSSLNKPLNIQLSHKNKINNNNNLKTEEETQINNINNNINNQPYQYMKQFKEIKIKENKFKIKSKKTGTNIQPQKLINKITNDLSLSFNTSNSQNSKNITNDYMSENISKKNSNYYYYKKDAILKKQQQQQNLKQIMIKKEKDSNIIINNDMNEINELSDDKEIIKENENYLSDENDNTNESNNNQNHINKNPDKENKQESKKIYLPSPMKSDNKSFKNLKEFTLEKIPTQKLNNSFTLEQNKENVKIYIESNNSLNNKSNNEVISENIKLKNIKEEMMKKIKKNENEMKSISYGVYQHVINVYKTIRADNKDIQELTDSLIKYMKQNLIIKDNKDSENLYKTFKKSFYNYVFCEIELKNVENQIDKRKIGGIWFLSPNNNNKEKNDDDEINNFQ